MARDRLIGEDGGLFLAPLGTERSGDGTKSFDEHAGGSSGDGSGVGWWKIIAKTPESLGDEKTGDDSTTFDEHAGGSSGDGSGAGWWKITAKGATSLFDAELAVGDLHDDDGTGVMKTGDKAKQLSRSMFDAELAADDLHYDDGTGVMNTGDKAKQLSRSEIGNVVAWNADVSRNEIEMTTLHDKVKRYVYGKADWSGSIDGVLYQSLVDFVKRFVDIVEVSPTGAITKTARTETSIDFLGYLQKHTESGLIEQFLYLPSVELGGFNFGATDGSRQEFSCPWRFGVEAQGTPQMYLRAVA